MASQELTLRTGSAAETQALGEKVAGWLRAGDTLALSGELGAGKTAFTQGVARGLGICVPVTSPTFTLINQYRTSGGVLLQHVDCYRLANASLEMWDIGLGDLFAGDDIVVIESAERIRDLLPEEYLSIDFDYLDVDRRRLQFVAHGAHFAEVLAGLSVHATGSASLE